MAANRIEAIKSSDLTTPTATAQYPLGAEYIQYDYVNDIQNIYVYGQAHTGLTQYQPYLFDVNATAAPATLAAAVNLVVVPQVAFTASYYGFFLKEGNGKVLMTAETYAVGDHLQILNAGAALVVDGTSGATVKTKDSLAICREAGTTAVARDVQLLGYNVEISAT